MGILFTYGSYMKKDVDMEKAISQVEIMDTLIAFLAGLMIIPAVFAFSGKDSLNAGASLMFITMQKYLITSIRWIYWWCILFTCLICCFNISYFFMECSVATLMESIPYF